MVCEHNWENDNPITDDSIEREGDFIGFHVHCTLCGLKAVEWFEFSYSEVKKL